MRKLLGSFALLLLMLLPLSLSSAQLGPVWKGPRAQVAWQGMEAPVAEAPKPAAPSAITPDESVSDTPRWVGYVKRNRDDWFFRFVLKDGRSEMVKRGASTSDGWQVTGFDAQANRPTSVTITRDGAEKTLNLTPQ